MKEKKKKYTNMELLKRFVPYFKKYKFIFFTDLFAAAMTTGCELVFPLITRTLTNYATNPQLELTLSVLGKLAFLYLVLRVVELVGNYYKQSIGHIMGAKIETDMRRDAFDHLQKLSDSFYSETKVGKIMSRITNDLFDVTEFAHHCPEEYFIGVIKFTISFIILLRINVPLTLVIFSIIPIMIIVAGRYRKKMRFAFKTQREHIGELNAGIEDSLLGIKVVKSFANEDIEREKFNEGNLEFLDIKKYMYKYMAAFHTVTRAFDGIMYLSVILLGGFFMMRGSINAGDFVAYILYVGTLLTTVSRIVEFTEQFQKGMTGIERFVELMDADIEIFDDEDAMELKDVKGEIEFVDVSFKYHDNESHVLKDLNLKINVGERVALVGPSGSGKTTLCNLIPRFYNLTDGEIKIDGENINNYTLKSLRNSIGMVQQDVYLFSGSVLDNIIYGKPGATKKEAVEAARLAGALEFIEELPEGFDTYVGERGVKLSGGQKQRISIARVFLKNPPILILDEATSALDNESEHIVQKSLEKLAKGRTSLTIAHRLTTIKNSDRIYVLTDDGVVEEGNHEELLNKKGLYYSLYNSGNIGAA